MNWRPNKLWMQIGTETMVACFKLPPRSLETIPYYYCADKIIAAAALAIASTVAVAATIVVCSIVQLFDRLIDQSFVRLTGRAIAGRPNGLTGQSDGQPDGQLSAARTVRQLVCWPLGRAISRAIELVEQSVGLLFGRLVGSPLHREIVRPVGPVQLGWPFDRSNLVSLGLLVTWSTFG